MDTDVIIMLARPPSGLQTFFFKMRTNFLHISCLQAIYFVFLGPANNLLNIFHTPLQKDLHF